MERDESDEALMVRYQRGDVRAFEVLLTRHRKPVFNFILRFVREPAVAEDLLQETFLRVIKGVDAYEKQAKFTTWLYTIARNLCVDHSRRQKHRRAASLDAPMDSSEKDGATLLDVVSDKHARRGLNPQTGEDIVIPRRRVVRFEYSKKLKDELNP